MEQAPRKLYIDSRARVEGTNNHFTWSPVRPLYVPKSRAYFDSVSIPNVFKSVNQTNNKIYVTEQMGLRVTGLAQNMYWSDNGVQRISNLTPQTYADNAALASELQFRMGANYAVLPISGGPFGRIEIIATGGFRIYSRAELKQMKSFGGVTLDPNDLRDCYDMLGLVDTGIPLTSAGNPIALNLSDAVSYRVVTLPSGQFSLTEFATQLTTSLNAATQLNPASYSVTASDLTGKLTIQNSSSKTFTIRPELYLNKHGFPGFQAPWYASDHTTGFASNHADDLYIGNLVTGLLHVNFQRYHSIFISSSLGNHADSYGPRGQSSIAKKVAVDVPFGSMIHDSRSTGLDFLTLDAQSISSITFRLTDWEGHDVEIDSPWSCSIIIMPDELTF